jgi:hypothetical protein
MTTIDDQHTAIPLPPTLAWTYFGTEEVDGAPLTNFWDRLGNCYELSARALVGSTTPVDTVLIHGTIQGPRDMPRICHSWLRLPDGLVWEPIFGRVYREAEWNDMARVEIEREYDREAACIELLRTEVFGPWHACYCKGGH